MSVGTRLALSGLAAAAAAAALAVLSEGTAAAETAPAPVPDPVADAGVLTAAPVALHGQFAGAAPGPAEVGFMAPVPAPPAPPALMAASLNVPAPGAVPVLPGPDAAVFAAPAVPQALPAPALASTPEAVAPEPIAAPAGEPHLQRPVVLVPVAADTTTVPTLLSATVPAGVLPGVPDPAAVIAPAVDPATIPGAVIVPAAIPGSAPSRDLVLTPGPAPVVTVQGALLVHPLVAEAAVDKSAIVYDTHPVEKVTDGDIHAGLLSAGVNPALLGTFVDATRIIIGGESGGSTNAVNRWDSNARGVTQPDGAPGNSSRGLMQTIPGTFAAYHAPGTSLSIYDPHANIAAAWRYINSRYKVDLATGSGLNSFMGRGTGRGVGY